MFFWRRKQQAAKLLFLSFTFWCFCQWQMTATGSDDELLDNLSKITFQQWKEDAVCGKFRVQFIENRSHPLMALVSHPGSGNTWTRQIIEGVTGLFTGSVDEDRSIFRKGLYGEMMPAECGCTIVQKTHGLFQEKNNKVTSFNGSGILILRNPYKALISYRNYLPDTSDHVSEVSESHFQGPDWETYVDWSVPQWVDLALIWIESIRNGGVLHYENVVADRENEIRKLMKMLNFSFDEQRLQCVLKHDPKHFKRQSTRTFDPFTAEHKQFIDEAIVKVQKALEFYHFEPMPLHLFEYFNQSAYYRNGRRNFKI